ncbi:MAG TPA: O-antigen ligase family protein [Candidatus Limnocylindrales bacterium]|nr:O-antigen ligase family protein [Candidatus Limnocylindrales bacterium]
MASILVCAAAAIIGIATGESGIVVVAAMVMAIGALAIAIRPDTAALVVIAILYSNAAAIAVQRYDVPYFAGAAFPLLLVVPFAYHIVIRRQPIVIAVGLPWMLGFFIVMILGTVAGMAADPDKALESLVTFVVEGLLIYFVTTNVIRSIGDLHKAVWTLLLVGAVIGGLSVYQQATESFDNDYGGFAKVSQATIDTGSPVQKGQPRLAGPIGEKNRYAQVMVVLIPLALLLAWTTRRRSLRILAVVAAALIAAGAVLTFSRGAALGFAITIVLMTFLRYIRPTQLVAVAIGIAALFTIQPTYFERLLTIEALGGAAQNPGAALVEDDSFRKRANETIAALLVFADHPLLGVGRGLFPRYYGDYADEVGIISDEEARQAHNLYAGIAAETGLPGLICFIGIFASTLYALARVRRRTSDIAPQHAAMATAFFLAVVAYMTTGLFLHLAYERYLWILLALAASAAYVGQQVPVPEREPAIGPVGRRSLPIPGRAVGGSVG